MSERINMAHLDDAKDFFGIVPNRERCIAIQNNYGDIPEDEKKRVQEEVNIHTNYLAKLYLDLHQFLKEGNREQAQEIYDSMLSYAKEEGFMCPKVLGVCLDITDDDIRNKIKECLPECNGEYSCSIDENEEYFDWVDQVLNKLPAKCPVFSFTLKALIGTSSVPVDHYKDLF